MASNEQWLISAAVVWWKSRRPCSFTLEDHLINPTINTSGDEKSLAIEVAKYVETVLHYSRREDF